MDKARWLTWTCGLALGLTLKDWLTQRTLTLWGVASSFIAAGLVVGVWHWWENRPKQEPPAE